MEVFLYTVFVVSIFVTVFRSADTKSRRQLKDKYQPSVPDKIPNSELAELAVSQVLNQLPSESYVVFDNIVLPSRVGTPYTEIDHIVISPYGIWCVETKSHSGDIYGFTNAGVWKQYLGRKIYPISNPYKQNYKHLQAIINVLGIDDASIVHGLVVFPNARKTTIDYEVVDFSYRAALSGIRSCKKQVFSKKQCEMILQTIGRFNSIKSENLTRHLASC